VRLSSSVGAATTMPWFTRDSSLWSLFIVFALKVWREVYARQLITLCKALFFKIIIFELLAIGPPPNCWICRGDDFYLFYPRMCCFFFEIICLIYGFLRVRSRGRPFFPCGRSFSFWANKRGARARVYTKQTSLFSAFFLCPSWKCYVYVHMAVHRVRYLFLIHIHGDAHGWAAPGNHPREGRRNEMKPSNFFSYLNLWISWQRIKSENIKERREKME
jgi:hypothetical protein